MNRRRTRTTRGFYSVELFVALTMTRMRLPTPLLAPLLALALVACGSVRYNVKDASAGATHPPGSFRAAVLHLGADFGQRETREIALADVARNTREAHRLIRIAKQKGAEIVVTPEYGNTGNMILGEKRDWLGTRLPARPSDTPLFDLGLEGVQPYVLDYARLAAELNIWIVTSVLEREPRPDGTRYYNCGLVLDNRGCVRGVYRKIHLWWLTESTLEPGTEPTVVETPFGNFGMLICSDALAPGLWSDLVEKGADQMIMQSHWATSPYLGRLAMGAIAGWSDRTVLWSNHPGFLSGGAGFIRPGLINDDALSTFSGPGVVIADLPLPERLRLVASQPR